MLLLRVRMHTLDSSLRVSKGEVRIRYKCAILIPVLGWESQKMEVWWVLYCMTGNLLAKSTCDNLDIMLRGSAEEAMVEYTAKRS